MNIKLTSLVIAAIVTSASIITAPAVYSQSRSSCTAALRVKSRSARSGVINVRSGPGINYSAPHYGVVGDEVIILVEKNGRYAIETDVQGFKWVRVEFPKTGAKGWIRRDFISDFRC